jgi:hypothetical protein
MGLDMYLTKKYYVQNWQHTTPENKHEITITKGGLATAIPTDKIINIETEEIRWRKANAIHQWFVDNVQDGVDNCGDSYVDRGELRNLLGVIETVLKDHSKASELLPTTEGFFFGGTEYDEYYFAELEHTQKQLSLLLVSDTGEGDFYYNSSW